LAQDLILWQPSSVCATDLSPNCFLMAVAGCSSSPAASVLCSAILWWLPVLVIGDLVTAGRDYG